MQSRCKTHSLASVKIEVCVVLVNVVAVALDVDVTVVVVTVELVHLKHVDGQCAATDGTPQCG